MFEHSVKVPRQFKVAASIVKKVSIEGGSVKTLLYDNKLRHFRTNVLYALVTSTIKRAAAIDNIFINTDILKNEPRLDPWLAKVLVTELLFGKKTLPGKSKPEQTILSYKEKFETYIADHQDDFKIEVTVQRPRYVRINTNLLTTSDAIRAFQEEGYRFVRCTSGSYDDYLQQIQNLTEDNFTQDYHIKTIFVFPPGTKLHTHPLYLENKIILQDKATAMAVHLLAPASGSVVLDMCAAPGMKTTQLAAYMRNEGKVYAVERNEERYKTLCEFVDKTGSKCVTTICKDALDLKRGDYDDVQYIVLDPSCSGSGMDLSVHNYIEQERLAKLTSLQEKFLKHAMNSFPNAKKIVYSTCSIFPEENERVITNVVKTSRNKWRVQDVKDQLKGKWNNFGSNMYGSIGARCLYAKPDSDMTIGFFLAVLERDQKDFGKRKNYTEERINEQTKSENDLCNNQLGESSNSTTIVRSKKRKSEIDYFEEHNKKTMDLGENIKKKKKKNKEYKASTEDNHQINELKESETLVEYDEESEHINTKSSKNKKKQKSKDIEENIENNLQLNEPKTRIETEVENQEATNNDINVIKKKKKSKRSTVEDNLQLNNSNEYETQVTDVSHSKDIKDSVNIHSKNKDFSDKNEKKIKKRKENKHNNLDNSSEIITDNNDAKNTEKKRLKGVV